jgi:hypothetical protein
MIVQVDTTTMTLKIMDCNHFEGAVLDLTNNKTIEVLLIDATTPDERAADIAEGARRHPKQKVE